MSSQGEKKDKALDVDMITVSLDESAGAVFLDRDGVLSVEDGAFVTRPEDLRLLAGAAEAVAKLNAAGWKVVVFTNQSAVGRGLLTAETLDAIHDRLRQELAAAGAALTAVYACIHHPTAGCDCRKPLPGMLLQAAREHNIDLAKSYAIGDSPRDIAAAHAAGCIPLLVLSGHTHTYDPASFPNPQPMKVFPDLPTAVEWLTESDFNWI